MEIHELLTLKKMKKLERRIDRINKICKRIGLYHIDYLYESFDRGHKYIHIDVPDEILLIGNIRLIGINHIVSQNKIRIMGKSSISWNTIDSFYEKYGECKVFTLHDIGKSCSEFITLDISKYVKNLNKRCIWFYEKCHSKEFILNI